MTFRGTEKHPDGRTGGGEEEGAMKRHTTVLLIAGGLLMNSLPFIGCACSNGFRKAVKRPPPQNLPCLRPVTTIVGGVYCRRGHGNLRESEGGLYHRDLQRRHPPKEKSQVIPPKGGTREREREINRKRDGDARDRSCRAVPHATDTSKRS